MIEHLQGRISTVGGARALDLGAGDGGLARWLVEQGFEVDVVDRNLTTMQATIDPAQAQKVQFYEQDLREFTIMPDTYSVITAVSVLHFLLPSELPRLIDRIIKSMAPGGFLACEVLTQDDPERTAFIAQGRSQVEPDTFPIPEEGFIHYFAPGELAQLFNQLETIHYSEERHADPEGEWGYRSLAVLLASKPSNPH